MEASSARRLQGDRKRRICSSDDRQGESLRSSQQERSEKRGRSSAEPATQARLTEAEPFTEETSLQNPRAIGTAARASAEQSQNEMAPLSTSASQDTGISLPVDNRPQPPPAASSCVQPAVAPPSSPYFSPAAAVAQSYAPRQVQHPLVVPNSSLPNSTFRPQVMPNNASEEARQNGIQYMPSAPLNILSSQRIISPSSATISPAFFFNLVPFVAHPLRILLPGQHPSFPSTTAVPTALQPPNVPVQSQSMILPQGVLRTSALSVNAHPAHQSASSANLSLQAPHQMESGARLTPNIVPNNQNTVGRMNQQANTTSAPSEEQLARQRLEWRRRHLQEEENNHTSFPHTSQLLLAQAMRERTRHDQSSSAVGTISQRHDLLATSENIEAGRTEAVSATSSHARALEGISIPLLLRNDKAWLTESECFLREKCCELFSATREDIKTYINGRRKPIFLGQVGVRCTFCAKVPHEARAKRAACFPSTVARVQKAFLNLKHVHFPSCPNVTKEMRDRFEAMRRGHSHMGSSDYRNEEMHKLLVDAEEGGVRFRVS